MAFGRRRNIDKKIEKNIKMISYIIFDVGNKYLNENIKNKRNEVYSNDIINIKNQIEYIINIDKKLKFFYKKNKNIDLYKHLIGDLKYFKSRIRKSNDIDKYLNHYNKIDILINGKNNNNLIEN